MARVSEIQKGNTVKLVTHAGNFHSDDVTATALLQLYFEKKGIRTELVRTFKPADAGYTDSTPNCVVYDIGLGQYDHHQVGPDAFHCLREDPDGVTRKYAAVGLLWREIGEELVGKYSLAVYDGIIKPIDDHDNGNGHNPLSTLIGNMNPTRSNPTETEFEVAFCHAVHLIKEMLCETFKKYRTQLHNEEELRKYAKAGNAYLISPTFMSGADEVCREMGIPFYVYPNIRGGWCFKTICPDPKNMSVHFVDIPDEVRTWTGVNFLHPSCFLGSADTKERACEICENLCHAPYSNYLD